MTRTRFVAGLYCTDAALTLAYLVNVWAGHPYMLVSRLLDLDGEANLPTWYSSEKLFLLALLLGLFAVRAPGRARSRLLLLPAVLTLVLSMDEVASIHEWVGFRSDALLAGGERVGTLLPVTGIWMFLLGPLLLLVTAVAYRAMSPWLAASPAAKRLYLAGFSVMILGAMGVELAANVVTPGTWAATLQIAVEELGELVGISTLLWATLELLGAHGIPVMAAEAARAPGVHSARHQARQPIVPAGRHSA